MRHALYMLLASLMLLWAPAPASAQSTTPVVTCSGYAGVTNRVVGCIREAVNHSANNYFTKFYTLLARAVGAFITLGVMIYGVMFASGMIEKPGREVMMLLLKVAMVAYFTQNTPLMYEKAMAAMDAAGEMVVQVSPQVGLADGQTDYSDMPCYSRMQEASTIAGKPMIGPWLAMDCILDTVIGINIPSNAGSVPAGAIKDTINSNLAGQGIGRGMIFFFFSGMQTSTIGMMMGILGFIFIWGIIAMIIKSLLTYVAGYIGIAFMMIISPLFIPLVLFRTTKEYFDKWVKLTISFGLQPVLIMLFVSLAVAAVDLAVYSGDYSVMYRLAGEKSRVAPFSLNSYLKDSGAIKTVPKTLTLNKLSNEVPTFAKDLGKGLFPVATSDCKQDGSTQGEVCNKVAPVQIFHESIDWDKLAALRNASGPAVATEAGSTDGQQIAREVLAAMIFAGVVIFVMNRMMAVVPHVLVDLVGDFGQTPNLFRTTTEQWNTAAGKAGGGVSASIRSTVESMTNRRAGGD